MKTEIEHTQHLLHMAKVKVQQEFEAWWQNQVAKVTRYDVNAVSLSVSYRGVGPAGVPGGLRPSPSNYKSHSHKIPQSPQSVPSFQVQDDMRKV
jgi:hypothetical protein